MRDEREAVVAAWGAVFRDYDTFVASMTCAHAEVVRAPAPRWGEQNTLHTCKACGYWVVLRRAAPDDEARECFVAPKTVESAWEWAWRYAEVQDESREL